MARLRSPRRVAGGVRHAHRVEPVRHPEGPRARSTSEVAGRQRPISREAIARAEREAVARRAAEQAPRVCPSIERRDPALRQALAALRARRRPRRTVDVARRVSPARRPGPGVRPLLRRDCARAAKRRRVRRPRAVLARLGILGAGAGRCAPRAVLRPAVGRRCTTRSARSSSAPASATARRAAYRDAIGLEPSARLGSAESRARLETGTRAELADRARRNLARRPRAAQRILHHAGQQAPTSRRFCRTRRRPTTLEEAGLSLDLVLQLVAQDAALRRRAVAAPSSPAGWA